MTDAQSIAARLPAPRDLERRCMSLAMLDAVLSPDWQSRYYSFNRRWSPETGTRMASMRNGSGDEFFILFFPDGSAALKGFAHESRALAGQSSIAGVFEGLPARFAEFANEPAFSPATTTFCLWNEGGAWQRSRAIGAAQLAVDGSAELLALLVGAPADYVAFVRDYFEREVANAVVARFYAHETLTAELASALDADASLAPIADDIDQIGYPAAV
jgi:hypothetical protein